MYYLYYIYINDFCWTQPHMNIELIIKINLRLNLKKKKKIKI